MFICYEQHHTGQAWYPVQSHHNVRSVTLFTVEAHVPICVPLVTLPTQVPFSMRLRLRCFRLGNEQKNWLNLKCSEETLIINWKL